MGLDDPAGRMDSGVGVDDVRAAQDGDRIALSRVVRGLQPLVMRLALRFFGNPVDAEDAAQEALIQIVTKLDRFDGRSEITTWAYRVATNKFLSISRSRRDEVIDIEWFSRELTRPLFPAEVSSGDLDQELLAEEIKVGCTLGMLLCLEPGHRMAYVLGEIMGLDQATGAAIMEISPAAFRKRLQRSRGQITDLMRSRCGLFDPTNACRCDRRVPIALNEGWVDPENLLFAPSRKQIRRFPAVLAEIRRLEEAERAGALYRSHPEAPMNADLAGFVERLFTEWPDVPTRGAPGVRRDRRTVPAATRQAGNECP